jgi:hypothetical protein
LGWFSATDLITGTRDASECVGRFFGMTMGEIVRKDSKQRVRLGVFTALFILAGCTQTTTNNITQQQVVVSQPAKSGQSAAIPTGAIVACSLEEKLNALSGEQRITIAFQNQTGADISLFFLDYNGHRKAYGTIENGRSRLQQTFITHPWVITDATGKCIEIVMPGRSTQTVVVKSTPVVAGPPTTVPAQ